MYIRVGTACNEHEYRWIGGLSSEGIAFDKKELIISGREETYLVVFSRHCAGVIWFVLACVVDLVGGRACAQSFQRFKVSMSEGIYIGLVTACGLRLHYMSVEKMVCDIEKALH